MNGIVDVIVSTDFVFTTIRVMTPVLFAALACMVFGKGGIDAIATEGIMLISALAGVLGSYFTHSALGGVLFAVIIGILMSMVFGYITLTLESEPILAGIALNTFATGITIFVIYLLTGNKGSTQSLNNEVVPNIELVLIKDIPILGEILSGHNILTYLAMILVGILAIFIYKTPTGLRIRTVGENEESARSVGINVMKYKYIALTVAGTMAGLGGAFMSLGYVSFFSRDMIAGRGFIGMAAESMGRGTPIGVLISSVLFGMADSLAIRLQLLDVPPQLIQLLPYLITIIAISLYSYSKMNKRNRNLN
ncbi:ABC transporter permease [Vallitalea okinawensis]|uniref:ABC transporter permease n=1 Tax=Vallitalea okinawensis TaxID=2078660 RepID=UPI001479602A|nr:ABC transporter permease [Vallitalea okinawensis]